MKGFAGGWGGAKPFCRARPVRAPLAGKCLRTWKALRKAARGAAPSHVRSIGFPVVRAQGAHGKTALRLAMCGALAFQLPARPLPAAFHQPLATSHQPLATNN